MVRIRVVGLEDVEASIEDIRDKLSGIYDDLITLRRSQRDIEVDIGRSTSSDDTPGASHVRIRVTGLDIMEEQLKEFERKLNELRCFADHITDIRNDIEIGLNPAKNDLLDGDQT